MKTIQHNIGGELRNLDFTRAGLMDHISDVTGKDAFEFFDQFKPDEEGNINVPKDTVSVLTYAGINSALDVEGKPNVSIDKVKQWIRALPMEDLNSFFNAILTGISVEGQGEGQSQPNQGSESVGGI